ncbi:hypothetical protein QTV49_004786 [Vibrio vulnificus]|nr:hypothetical protein [Vibrio vulnificus]
MLKEKEGFLGFLLLIFMSTPAIAHKLHNQKEDKIHKDKINKENVFSLQTEQIKSGTGNSSAGKNIIVSAKSNTIMVMNEDGKSQERLMCEARKPQSTTTKRLCAGSQTAYATTTRTTSYYWDATTSQCKSKYSQSEFAYDCTRDYERQRLEKLRNACESKPSSVSTSDGSCPVGQIGDIKLTSTTTYYWDSSSLSCKSQKSTTRAGGCRFDPEWYRVQQEEERHKYGVNIVY